MSSLTSSHDALLAGQWGLERFENGPVDSFSEQTGEAQRMTTDLALQALLASVWRRKPKDRLLGHSDQGSQFVSREWRKFLDRHNLEPSMSRRGNCHEFKRK